MIAKPLRRVGRRLNSAAPTGAEERPRDGAAADSLADEVRNVDKEADFINGMEATVVDYDERSSCVHVVTATGRHLAVYPLTDYVEDCGSVIAYPMRPGYASTVHKLQGAELPHITIWLDIRDARAAGYVAMSRVSYDADYWAES